VKLVLIYDLPEERSEARNALQSQKYLGVLFAVAEELRQRLKYREMSEEQYAATEELQRFFLSALEERGVNLYEEE